MKKLMSNIWAKVVIVLAFIVGVLLYILKVKNTSLDAFKAKVHLVKTKEEAMVLEAKIMQRMDEHKENKKELAKLESDLVVLKKKKAEVSSAKEIENYWENN